MRSIDGCDSLVEWKIYRYVRRPRKTSPRTAEDTCYHSNHKSINLTYETIRLSTFKSRYQQQEQIVWYPSYHDHFFNILCECGLCCYNLLPAMIKREKKKKNEFSELSSICEKASEKVASATLNVDCGSIRLWILVCDLVNY